MEHHPIHCVRQRIWLALMAFVLVLVGSLLVGQHLYARHLVERNTPIPQGIQQSLEPGQVAHYQVEVQVRRDPALHKPPDPYHMPEWTERIAQPLLVDVWLSRDVSHSITRWKDSPETVLAEDIVTPDGVWSYVAAMAHVSQMPPPKPSETDAVSQVKETRERSLRAWYEGARIESIADSSWGGLAWTISFPATPVSPENFPGWGDPWNPTDTTPYARDLDFQKTQWVWQVDAATGWVISRRWLALTQPEPTVLYAEILTRPEFLHHNAVSISLDHFYAPEAQELAQAASDSRPATSETEVAQMALGTEKSLEVIAQEVAFPLLAPQVEVLQGLGFASHERRIYFTPSAKCHLARPLAYSFDLCAGLDGTVRVDDILWSQSDFSDVRGIQTSLGPAQIVLGLLHQARPRWVTSQAVSLTVDGQPVTAWLAFGFHGDGHALMFEFRGTFVQLSGYGISPQVLIQIAETIEVLPTERFKIFLPGVNR